MKKHYLISIVDSLTNQTIQFHQYGMKKDIMVEDKMVIAIVNEYQTPLYIQTINTLAIEEIQ